MDMWNAQTAFVEIEPAYLDPRNVLEIQLSRTSNALITGE